MIFFAVITRIPNLPVSRFTSAPRLSPGALSNSFSFRAAMEDATCASCSEEQPKATMTPAGKNADGEVCSWRCVGCNRGRQRVRDALKRHPSIEDMASEVTDKVVISQKAKDLYGEDLVAFLRQQYSATYEVSNKVQMMGNGTFLDEEDLKEKYKSKPLRLAAIMKNTQTFFYTTSEPLLYEDMEYTSNRTDSAAAKRTLETVVTSKESKIKPPKKHKPESPPTPINSEAAKGAVFF